MSHSEPVRVLPLWIGGHAYLTMAPAFFDVRDVRSGEIRRRTPLCGAAEAATAVASAAAALPDWCARTPVERATLLTRVGVALLDYADHLAGLIAEETGKDAQQAALEVAQAVALLRMAAESETASTPDGVLAIVSDHQVPLSGPLRHAVPALLAGATVVLKPSPKAPSATFALAELTALSGFPGGVVNILQGDLAAVEALCAVPAVSTVRVAGEAPFCAKVRAIAARHGRALES